MKIHLGSMFADDQYKALRFYTTVTRFVKERELQAGDCKQMTVVSSEGPDDIELLVERSNASIAKTRQEGGFQAGIAATSFAVGDVQEGYTRLTELGVGFRRKPTKTGPVPVAVFDDTWVTSYRSFSFNHAEARSSRGSPRFRRRQ